MKVLANLYMLALLLLKVCGTRSDSPVATISNEEIVINNSSVDLDTLCTETCSQDCEGQQGVALCLSQRIDDPPVDPDTGVPLPTPFPIRCRCIHSTIERQPGVLCGPRGLECGDDPDEILVDGQNTMVDGFQGRFPSEEDNVL